ncbi:MAG: hypothetical protein U5L76_01570 [Patescibacteria group bacterium]|nr:hypothetical protein [Patescibacteria group bacterium]
MPYPHLKFRKNAKKDFESLCLFVDEAKYSEGRNLNWAVFEKYPHLKKYFNINKDYKIKNQKMLQNFIKQNYQSRGKGMDKALKKHKRNWQKVAPNFFFLVDEIFKKREWPQGKYIAYGTIWHLYPRYLEDKTFQIPFWHSKAKYILVVIAHELLHFMFYDYFYKRLAKYHSRRYNFFVWHISEVFNNLIQNSSAWLNCFKMRSLIYPQHKKIVNHIKSTLDKKSEWNLDDLVDLIIKEVKKEFNKKNIN